MVAGEKTPAGWLFGVLLDDEGVEVLRAMCDEMRMTPNEVFAQGLIEYADRMEVGTAAEVERMLAARAKNV